MKGLLSGLAVLLWLAPGAMAAKTVDVETIEVDPAPEPDGPVIPTDHLPAPVSEREPAGAAATSGESAGGEEIDKPQVSYGTAGLPKPVARMHAQMREAALSGDIDRMRIILESNEVPPTLSFTEIDDPIDFLKESSGDGEGYEILAILADTLDAGYVHVDADTPQEMYIWPYFARYPIHDLTPDQQVELYRIVTHGDYADMLEFGAWTFYRIGIGPDGTLHYFVAGD